MILTSEPLDLVFDSTSLNSCFNLCDDADTVSAFKSAPKAPGAGESYNISNLGGA